MKRAWITILFIVSGCVAQEPLPDSLCILDPAAMPESWRPSGEEQEALSSTAPWTEREAQDAKHAIRVGLREMIDLFQAHPESVEELWEDSVGALIEVTYSSANEPALDKQALDAARRNLEMLIEPLLDRDAASFTCEDYELLLPLAIYTYKLLPAGDPRNATMVSLANSAFHSCESFDELIDEDYPDILEDDDGSTDDLFDLVIWSLLFIEAEVYPELDLSAEAREFSAILWRYFEDYHLEGADEFEDGAWDDDFIEIAYLATHIAYLPTGNHRFPIYIEDSPNLYRYHRENFYEVLEMGELDLVAEFVDSLRQYGCTPENDLQVRDGTRYLLDVFRGGGDLWMTYREEGETDDDLDNYDLIHKPWTGVLGVRDRNLEPANPGTYGGVVRRWLPPPASSVD